MPQSKHVFFDTNGTKEVYFDEQARWALAPDIKGEHGVLMLQPVGATDLPPNSLAPIEDFDPIGLPLQVFFKRPESIDSLIDALVKLRSMMAYEETKPKSKAKAEEESEDLLFDGINLEEAAKVCMSIGMSPKEYLQRRAKEMGIDFNEAVIKKFGDCGCPRCQQNLAELTGEEPSIKNLKAALKAALPKELQDVLTKMEKGDMDIEVIRVPMGEMPEEVANFLKTLKK